MNHEGFPREIPNGIPKFQTRCYIFKTVDAYVYILDVNL